MTFLSKIFIKMSAHHVGSDALAIAIMNRAASAQMGRSRRYVVYKGEVEASKVPSDWHGWLHYTEMPRRRKQA